MIVVKLEDAIAAGLSCPRTKTWPTWAEVRADAFLYARHLAHQRRYYRRRNPLGKCARCGTDRYHGNSTLCRACRRGHRRSLARERQRRFRALQAKR